MDLSNTILSEAARLTSEDRHADYGHPLDDFSAVTAMLNALGFRRRTAQAPDSELRELVPDDWPIMMQCCKLSREWNRPKRDNRTDGAGYWNTLQMLIEERECRSS